MRKKPPLPPEDTYQPPDGEEGLLSEAKTIGQDIQMIVRYGVKPDARDKIAKRLANIALDERAETSPRFARLAIMAIRALSSLERVNVDYLKLSHDQPTESRCLPSREEIEQIRDELYGKPEYLDQLRQRAIHCDSERNACAVGADDKQWSMANGETFGGPRQGANGHCEQEDEMP